MQKSIFKKFIVLFSLSFVLFGFNFVFAEKEDVTLPEPPITEEIIVPAIATSDVVDNKNFIIEKSIIVPDNCSIKDLSGKDYVFPQIDSPSKYLGICALDAALKAGYISDFKLVNSTSLGLYLQSINNVETKSTEYWAIWLNGKYAECGLGCLSVSRGDTLSIILTAFDPVTYTETKLDYIVTLKIGTPNDHSLSGSISNNIVSVPLVEKTFSIPNAFEFLYKNQKNDKSYGAPMYTDWVAIALSLGDNQTVKSNLINYFKSNPISSSILTDYERRAMALMSLGVNPYNGTEVNYIKKITDSFDGKQFGDKELVNDDIFALVVLKNAGYGEKDEIILKDIDYIISKQDKEGSWGSIDMTSAGIQALKSFENIDGVKDSISKAENYLISKQEKDGGFENPFSTSWVLQSLFGSDAILKTEKFLTLKQEEDGGMENMKDDINSRIWVTAYTIPAILHKPWSEILNNFSKLIKKEIIKKSVEKLEQNKNLLENQNLNNEDTILPVTNNFWSKLKNSFKQFLIYFKF